MWYMMDKLGSVRENVDANGNVLDSITYDTYGNILAENHPSSGDRFKYTSREWDSEIGQYFYRARYYGPAIGRFESEDPSGFNAGDTNLYRYVRNLPTDATDPSGFVLVQAPKSKIIKEQEAAPFSWEGVINAKLIVWSDGGFDIKVEYDTWNGRECDDLGEGHIMAIHHPDFQMPKPGFNNPAAGGAWPDLATEFWYWTTRHPDDVFLDSTRRIKRFHKDRKGFYNACSVVQWWIYGQASGVFTDRLGLRIQWWDQVGGDRLTIDYSIALLPESPPYTEAITAIQIGKDSDQGFKAPPGGNRPPTGGNRPPKKDA